MSISESIESRLKTEELKSKEEMKVMLGGETIMHYGQATNGNALGRVIVNTAEGMMTQEIMIPSEGVADKNYVLEAMQKRPVRGTYEHREGGNHLGIVGGIYKPYFIAPGVVMIKYPNEHEFNGKLINSLNFDIPRSPDVHFSEDGRVKIDKHPFRRAWALLRGGMGD